MIGPSQTRTHHLSPFSSSVSGETSAMHASPSSPAPLPRSCGGTRVLPCLVSSLLAAFVVLSSQRARMEDGDLRFAQMCGLDSLPDLSAPCCSPPLPPLPLRARGLHTALFAMNAPSHTCCPHFCTLPHLPLHIHIPDRSLTHTLAQDQQPKMFEWMQRVVGKPTQRP